MKLNKYIIGLFVVAVIFRFGVQFIYEMNVMPSSIDWESIQKFASTYFSDSLSILAVFVSFLAYRTSRKQTELLSKEQKEKLQEKENKRLSITVVEAAKIETSKHLSLWTTKFIVNNKDVESVFFSEVYIRLRFKLLLPRQSWLQFWLQIFFPSTEREETFGFSLYESGFSSSGKGTLGKKEVPMLLEGEVWDTFIHNSTHLFNWETQERIQFRRRNEHRGPAPTEKEIWILFGQLPLSLAENLNINGFFLSNIDFEFYTDKGVINASSRFAEYQSLSDKFINHLNVLANKDPVHY